MESKLEIPIEELRRLELAIFNEAMGKPEDVYSTAELAELFGISESGVRKRLKEAIAAGRMELVKYMDYDSSGRRARHMGYRIVEDDRD